MMDSNSIGITVFKGVLGASVAALTGALIMAMFRVPKTRMEVFAQGTAALGGSFLFGETVANAAIHFLPFVVSSYTIYGIVGALSWGVFGGLAHLRDKIGKKPITDLFKKD